MILSCYWFPLLDAKKWELILITQCPTLVEFELGCNGHDDDNAYKKAGLDFDKRCETRTFWKKRNAIQLLIQLMRKMIIIILQLYSILKKEKATSIIEDFWMKWIQQMLLNKETFLVLVVIYF
ncbi:unnamed protein product [Adineta steineri]|uniref:Uncharacterized protein n=1 Tax=Adineta steineri TaxID=433720 RepID=A0A819Q8A9_9BILA|nr:unnamed protein product [Adineta steineri]CAF1449623.1 unnamed protein product [Adineta steineri]CAF1458984.1 unnamed protein product [Adineta steineri]CAF4008085.1 unnamed protein product [Adineta steineri]CAF4020336.1 unnamed protein product [Adineta steineri]